ncbi:DEAD/DEAH box helicase family protein [Candidatus Kaiserbacteria bacterium]|nr:DEAD/DEAH box helicase family protein [Candidatus Kaiserbacteria bacterium]
MPDKNLSERDICTKYITPAVVGAGWNVQTQIREEVTFTAGRINVYGKTITRGEKKRADYILYYKNNFPIALIEAKDASHSVGDGMQQALSYAESLDIPFVYSSNGEGFLEHDRLTASGQKEHELPISAFPSPADLYQRYKEQKGLVPEVEEAVLQDYYENPSAHPPRYFQQVAINRTVEAVARGQNRILLVMATGTGKTYTAFQIIWRLWKARKKKRILFLVDRTALADQTLSGEFRHFGEAVTKIDDPKVNPAYEIYVALYQGLMGGEEAEKFKQFSADFFDLVIVDECHRGAAREDALWRSVLEYYKSATHIGLTATPKVADDADNFEYFGAPIYTYSLKQGIDDGYLAPYKVIRYRFNNDEWRPPQGFIDMHGQEVPDEIYTESMFDRSIIIEDRNRAVAKCVSDFMRETDIYQKVIVFCVDIAHAERMRRFLVNEFADEIKKNAKYVVKITGDDFYGKLEIENFINPESKYPVIATTSKLLSTGVDTQTVKLIVLDAPMNSMTEFKQVIGRGTRINEQFGKYYFTIMDFRNVTRLFADADFDGDPVESYEKDGAEPLAIKEKIEQETRSEAELQKINPQEEILIDGTEAAPKPKKIHIKDGVTFDPIQKLIQYIDPKTGKLITASLQDFSKQTIQGVYASLEDFLNRWNATERKDAIISELADMGIVFDELQKEVGKDLDVFDLVLHVAYGKKPLTRSERLKKVRASDYFAKYEGRAREIIDHLLDKYAASGITAIDDIGDLQVSPFTAYGTPFEIVEEIFGGREKYLQVVRHIETVLYTAQ